MILPLPSPWIRLDTTGMIINSQNARSEQNYDAVIAQLDVENAPRYRRDASGTKCNIFAWDVTWLMGAEVPHWAMGDGTPATHHDGNKGASELTANHLFDWLLDYGRKRAGWAECSKQDAQDAANGGRPTVASWQAPVGQIGHIGVVRPGQWRIDGPWLAQAGARNFERQVMRECFGVHSPRYFTHS